MPDACLGHRVPFTYSFIPRSRLQTNPLQKTHIIKDAPMFCAFALLAHPRWHLCISVLPSALLKATSLELGGGLA